MMRYVIGSMTAQDRRVFRLAVLCTWIAVSVPAAPFLRSKDARVAPSHAPATTQHAHHGSDTHPGDDALPPPHCMNCVLSFSSLPIRPSGVASQDPLAGGHAPPAAVRALQESVIGLPDVRAPPKMAQPVRSRA
jgi:hypothetical protein